MWSCTPVARRTDMPGADVGPGWRYVGDEPNDPAAWIGGFLPHPSLVDDPENLLRAAPWSAPESAAYAPDNLLRGQNLVRRAVWFANAPRGHGDAPFWLAAEDVEIRPRGGRGRPFTCRTLFAAARRHGVTPHGRGLTGDPIAAAILVNALARRRPGATPEEDVLPCHLLGITEGDWARSSAATSDGREEVDRGTFQSDTIAKFGSNIQTGQDVAAMGAGRIRRLKQSDISYACLFPEAEVAPDFYLYGTEVPPPADLLQEIRLCRQTGEVFGRLSPIAELVWFCLGAGIRMDLTPVNGGGGITTNYTNQAGYIPTSTVTFGEHTWADITAAMPGWQKGLLIPSGYGFDAFYWDKDDVGQEPPGTSAELYQRYALTVWPTGEPESSSSGVQARYANECRRRKALAVAAFSQGIAEWLVALDRTIADTSGQDVYAVIDTIELGNELELYWETKRPPAHTPNSSVYEVGRYLALIAGPIQAALPDMRFRTELHGWQRESSGHPPWSTNWDKYLNWVGDVVEVGIVAEVRRWREVQLHQALVALANAEGTTPPTNESADRWLASCEAAGWQWPPAIAPASGRLGPTAAEIRAALAAWLPIDARNLLDELGTHYYHYTDRELRGRTDVLGYSDSNELYTNLVNLSTIAAGAGFSLTPTCGELGFQAHDPGPPPGLQWEFGYYKDTSPRFQAAMLVRHLAASLAAGATMASVFTFTFGTLASSTPYSLGYTFGTWNTFFTMGTHNDVESPGAPYSRAPDCWRRPLWYAFRRLAWLVNHASAVSAAHHARGCTVVQLDLRVPVGIGPDGAPLRRGWRRAFLVWLDQYADSFELHARSARGNPQVDVLFDDPDDTFFELVSTLPDVVPQSTPDCRAGPSPAWCLAEGGYPAPSGRVSPNPDWYWSGWDAALTFVAHPALSFVLTVAKADPNPANPVIAPLCVLTNATFKGAR